jgi:hypothetical protein
MKSEGRKVNIGEEGVTTRDVGKSQTSQTRDVELEMGGVLS